MNWNHKQIMAFCPHCAAAKDTDVWRRHVTFVNALPTAHAALALARARANASMEAGLPVLVMEDSDHREEHVAANMQAYAGLVTVGSYMVVQDTRFGRGVGTGPSRAIARFLEAQQALPAATREWTFKRDRSPEYFLFSQHSGGFLQRRS